MGRIFKRRGELGALFFGQIVLAGAQRFTDPIQRIASFAAPAQGGLLDALATLV